MKLCLYKEKKYLYLRKDVRGRELVDPETGEALWVEESEVKMLDPVYPDFTLSRKPFISRTIDWLKGYRQQRAEISLAPKPKTKKTSRSTSPKKKTPKPKVEVSPEILANLEGLPADVREKTLKAIRGC